MGFIPDLSRDGGGVGGTWYWNRYPDARFDSESYAYIYSFSEELLQEWDWAEHYSAQPENEAYLNFVADKFDHKKDIEFNARIKTAHWHEENGTWHVQTEDGREARAQYLPEHADSRLPKSVFCQRSRVL